MLAPGFADPVLTSQKAFRAVMEATAHPGTVVPLGAPLASPPPLTPTAAAIALTLLDFETPVWLDGVLADAPDVSAWLRFHSGAPRAPEPGQAAFALVADPAGAPDFATFALGSADYPDRSTTLVLQVERFGGGPELLLAGPGIAGARTFSAQPLPDDFAARLAANRARFPLGIDVLLAGPGAVAALPRSVRVLER